MNPIQKFLEALGLGELWNWLGQSAENKGAKIPMQEKAIREQAVTRVIKHHKRQDRIQDKDLRKSPKILYYFDSIDEFTKSIAMTGNERALYYGDKNSILKEIKWDIAKILTREQERLFRKLVGESDKSYFAIKIHPLTLHA